MTTRSSTVSFYSIQNKLDYQVQHFLKFSVGLKKIEYHKFIENYIIYEQNLAAVSQKASQKFD
jgi:hypothetical protein